MNNTQSQLLIQAVQDVIKLNPAPVIAKSGNNPTEKTYTSLQQAYHLFNKELFAGILPHCLITMKNNNKKSYGFFSSKQFKNTTSSEVTDEIALNPLNFKNRTTQEVLSTLVHEMVHLWQYHNGKASKGYHNKQWSLKMQEVGLIPSNTGMAGGKTTGQQMTHYILTGGAFDIASKPLVSSTILYSEQVANEAIAKKKAQSKTKYTCDTCEVNAWAKPNTHLICGHCDMDMESEAL